MNMNYFKGFRFHPTDQEAIELLFDKRVLDRDSIVQVGDSVVQVITQLNDICDFEPWELPERSELESGDNAWYFFCSPRYKYRKSERKNRLTKEGYWNLTGNPRHILTTYEGKKISGTRTTLVFYRGRVRNKKKKESKTPWVIHEFELTLNLPDIKSVILCKLKLKKESGKVDDSRGEEGQSSHSSLSNVEYHSTNNAIPKDQLYSNEPLTEKEAFNENSGIQTQFTANEQDDEDEFVDSILVDNDENQPYFGVENEGSKLPSNSQNFEDSHIQKEDFGERINQKPKGTDGCVGTQDQAYGTSEHDNSSRGSIVTANNQSYSKEGSNQHNIFADQNRSSTLPSDFIPMEHSEFDELLLRHGLFVDELLPPPEAAKNPYGVEYGNFSTNEQDDEFWNFTIDEVLGSKEQNLASETEGFNFSSTSTMESPHDPCLMESSRETRRVESEWLSSETDIPSGSGKTCEEVALI